VRRRRVCACGSRYTTYERLGRDDPRNVLHRLLLIAKRLSKLHRQLTDVQSDLE
jgi:transcriptional regulator NrdR family protein